jgi:hypothetical protein
MLVPETVHYNTPSYFKTGLFLHTAALNYDDDFPKLPKIPLEKQPQPSRGLPADYLKRLVEKRLKDPEFCLQLEALKERLDSIPDDDERMGNHDFEAQLMMLKKLIEDYLYADKRDRLLIEQMTNPEALLGLNSPVLGDLFADCKDEELPFCFLEGPSGPKGYGPQFINSHVHRMALREFPGGIIAESVSNWREEGFC